MRTALIYATKTGHSKKLAEAIANELKITALNINTDPKLEDMDLLFIVGGIYGNQSLPELLVYLKRLDGKKVKKAILITSCASKKTKQKAAREILTEKGIAVDEEEFICQGSFLIMGMGHPDKNDLDNAAAFAVKAVLGA